MEPLEPTPELLEAWAEWFDNPNESPLVVVKPLHAVAKKHMTAGFLLRRVADAFRASRQGVSDDSDAGV